MNGLPQHDEYGDLRDTDLFRLLVESVGDYAIFMLDPAGYVLSWNAGAERIKGYASEDIIGRHFSTFYPAAAVERGHPDEELRTAAAEGRFEEEGWRVRKDGTRRSLWKRTAFVQPLVVMPAGPCASAWKAAAFRKHGCESSAKT